MFAFLQSRGSQQQQQQRRDLLEFLARQDLGQGSNPNGGLGQSSGGDPNGGLGQTTNPNGGLGQTTVNPDGTLGQSDALSLGTLGTIFSVGAPVVSGLIDHFKNGNQQQQRREMEEILARAPSFHLVEDFPKLAGTTILNDLD